ncbi:hypothetical protein ACWEQG_01695 [Microbispora sp. NPDC004025]
MVAIWQATLWGLAGGVCVESLELYARIKRVRKWSWRKPIPQGLAAYLTSVAIRAGVGALLAAAAASSGQISGEFAALALGVAAPLVVEKLSRMAVVMPQGVDAGLNDGEASKAENRGQHVIPGVAAAEKVTDVT